MSNIYKDDRGETKSKLTLDRFQVTVMQNNILFDFVTQDTALIVRNQVDANLRI